MDGKFYKKLMLNGLGKSNYRKVSKVSRGTGNAVRRFIPDLSGVSAENTSEIVGLAGTAAIADFSIAHHNKKKKISHANASHIKIAENSTPSERKGDRALVKAIGGTAGALSGLAAFAKIESSNLPVKYKTLSTLLPIILGLAGTLPSKLIKDKE